MRGLRTLGLAALVASLVATMGCGPGDWQGYPFVGTASLRVTNDESSLRIVDRIYVDLVAPDWDDPFFEWGLDGAYSPYNLEPGEDTDLHDLTPGWWDVRVVWSDGSTTVVRDWQLEPGEFDHLRVYH